MVKSAPGLFRRRLVTAVSGVLMGAASSLASALGLGEISADSFLGQPFYGRVELVNVGRSIDRDNLSVRSVSPSEASAMGSDVFYGAHQLDVRVVERDGELFIEMTTGTPVKEPYLAILLELRWPSGVLYREYPVLLDPPPAISVPSQERPRQTAPDRDSPFNATSRPSSSVRSRAINLQALQTDEGRYRVERGDTLSTISARWVEGSSQSISEANQWLLENNPQAFVNGDMNRLIAGATLVMPDLSALKAQDEPATETAVTQAEASAQPAQDTAAVSSQATSDDSSASPDEQARIGADTAGVEDVRGLMTVSDNTDDRTRELIDMLSRENQNLRSRMQKVESSEYLTTMRELIQLQQKQIQDLQERLGEEEAPSTELQSMYESVDMAPVMPGAAGEEPVDESEALSKQEIMRESANNLDNLEVEQTNDQAIVEVEPQGVETLVDDRDEQRSRLITFLFIAGGILTAIFAAMLLYYRKSTAGRGEHDEDLPPMDSLRTEPMVNEPFAASQQADEYEEEVTGVAADPEDDFALTANSVEERPEKPARPWYGETASLDEDIHLDDEFNDLLQDEFSNLELDDEFLNDSRFDVSDASLEGFTNELQESGSVKVDEPQPEVEAKPEAVPEGKSKGEGKAPKDKIRRSDEEVRTSIAEKMLQYQTGERSSEDVMNTLELEEFEHLDEQGSYDEIESVVYRALMYCEFKKFEKARHLIELKMETEDDPRLAETLGQVEALEMESQKKNAI